MTYHNLREVDSAKEQWALEQKKAESAVVNDLSDLGDYPRGGRVIDVVRESYVPNPIGQFVI